LRPIRLAIDRNRFFGNGHKSPKENIFPTFQPGERTTVNRPKIGSWKGRRRAQQFPSRPHPFQRILGAAVRIPTQFDQLLAQFQQEHQPETPTEEALVQAMAEHYWLRHRAMRLEESCFDYTTGQIIDERKLVPGLWTFVGKNVLDFDCWLLFHLGR